MLSSSLVDPIGNEFSHFGVLVFEEFELHAAQIIDRCFESRKTSTILLTY
jgi:hypothetical protein